MCGLDELVVNFNRHVNSLEWKMWTFFDQIKMADQEHVLRLETQSNVYFTS